jgi:hypothetical protein
MGYDTRFKGSFQLDRPLTIEHANTLNSLNDKHLQGAPSDGYCDWEPNEDGTAIRHNGGEKSYQYVEWIQYIVENLIKPWGYVLNGSVDWHGDEAGDWEQWRKYEGCKLQHWHSIETQKETS